MNTVLMFFRKWPIDYDAIVLFTSELNIVFPCATDRRVCEREKPKETNVSWGLNFSVRLKRLVDSESQ